MPTQTAASVCDDASRLAPPRSPKKSNEVVFPPGGIIHKSGHNTSTGINCTPNRFDVLDSNGSSRVLWILDRIWVAIDDFGLDFEVEKQVLYLLGNAESCRYWY